MNKMLFSLFVCAAISFSWASRKQATEDWRLIAERKVSFIADKDVIILGNQGDEYSKLKLKVSEGPLKMKDMKVYFDNGVVQEVSMRSTIKEGEESRVVDLNGGLHRLTKIEIWYETKGFTHGKALVGIWGSK